MWRIAARYSTVGLEIAGSIAVGALGGDWLDDHFGTAPILFWIGLVFGTGAAVRAIQRVIRFTRMDGF